MVLTCKKYTPNTPKIPQKTENKNATPYVDYKKERRGKNEEPWKKN
jgi:hypothetical protein